MLKWRFFGIFQKVLSVKMSSNFEATREPHMTTKSKFFKRKFLYATRLYYICRRKLMHITIK